MLKAIICYSKKIRLVTRSIYDQSTDSTNGATVSECRVGNSAERGLFHLTLNFL